MNGSSPWWWWVLAACAAAWCTKWLGYAVPARWLRHPRMAQVAACMTVALLAALTVMNTWAVGTQLVWDARAVALGVAASALALRIPFLGVVVLGAVAAALVRSWAG